MDRILLVDDDEGLTQFLTRLLVRQGCEVVACRDQVSALVRLRREPFDAVVLDHSPPGLDGLDTLAQIKRIPLKTPVILATAYGTTETAIEAMKRGAYDYLLKPFDVEQLKRAVAQAVQVNRVMKELPDLPAPATAIAPAAGEVRLIGAHRRMQEVFKTIGQVAPQDIGVLIVGESGTGKELVARAIYHHSRRAGKVFLAVNCAAIPESLFESELFGYERGAFTGAERTHIGRLERCHEGTLFLDEIGDMSLATQAKLLRVLQEGEFERVGGRETIRVDVRVLAATNKNLETEVAAGRFREDLYYRLKVITLQLPPLRARIEDLPALVEYFVGRFSAQYGKPLRYVSEPAIRRLQAYHWPGNVRELENALRRAILMCKGDVLLSEDLLLDAQPSDSSSGLQGDPLAELRGRLDELAPEFFRLADGEVHANLVDLVEESLVRAALRQCNQNQVRAARLLGISRNTLRHRMEKYRLEGPGGEPPDS